jgi:1,4-alpha-glucan branching enzyme
VPGVSARAREQGALAIVLHTHMPYVEGFGTWPFGEEWLWEAIVGSYLPLLELLDGDAPITLSLTPVLCDQLEAPGLAGRFRRFVEEVRRGTHERDAAGLREGGHEQLAAELGRAWLDYAGALERLQERSEDLLGALAAHAQWTSSATHAILPLLATDAGVRAQTCSGIASHRRRFGGWRGGFWLPECAYAPWLEGTLGEAGVRSVCVELTSAFGEGSWEHLQPLAGERGVVLVPIDRATISLVWSEQGYPAGGAYRDYHRLTTFHHNPWNNAGGAYEHDAALALARAHAADFVARVRERLRGAAQAAPGPLPGGGLVVCALDTELLGHWWYEGVAWLAAVVEEAAAQGLQLVRLDDAPALSAPRALPPVLRDEWRPSSWGGGGDLSTWSAPGAAELAFGARAAELEVLGAGPAVPASALRELLALQSSDWAFLITRELAVSYARERFDGHRRQLARALSGADPAGVDAALRNIAPDARPCDLVGP